MPTKDPREKPSLQTQILTIRIELNEVDPSPWRTIWVPETFNLLQLHKLIQAAMGWEDYHLHEYLIGGARVGIIDPYDLMEEPITDERKVSLYSLIRDGIFEFRYLYDFGDGWEHTVRIQDIRPINRINYWAQCIDGKNACPPEDVGGQTGYEHYIEAIQDPNHEEHEDMWLWQGCTFHPLSFDSRSANARIASLKLGKALYELVVKENSLL